MDNGAVYWVGADNNIWYKGADGQVVNRGGAGDFFPGGNLSDGGASGHRSGSFAANRIDDPNRPIEQAPGAVVGSGGGSSPKVFNQAAADATRSSIDSLGGILAEALANAQRGYSNARGILDAQEKAEQEKYDESSVNNMQNYDSNLMASIRAGSTGLSGLRSALRGGGASGNDMAQRWAENTVGDTTSNDIREGFNTFDENRRGLDSSLSTFLTNLSGRRQENEDTLENNRRVAQRENAMQNQNLRQELAGLYGEADRLGERDAIIREASSFTPTIAANANARTSAYNTAPVDVKSANISAFETPEKQGMAADGGRTAQGIFSMNDPRRRRTSTEAEV